VKIAKSKLMTSETIDLSGLECPVPSIRTKRKLNTMATGSRLTVICTDPLTAIDIPFLVTQLGHQLVRQEDLNEKLVFEIEVVPGANKGESTWPTL
jgi:tRNA 2-thiouridine synthesizing protein A